ncbi:MAG TPA: FAD-binding protein [Gammaproteobacteria bacterium]|nr:FAD-binding protein [Gammaproteobacteria bacterium]
MRRLLSLLFVLVFPITVLGASCRCQPNEPCWPNAQDWAGLAKQLTGKLVKPELPQATLKNKNPFFLESIPGGTQTQQWAGAWHAQPSEYAVVAENTADIAAAVNFAHEHNLRVVIKGTGHDYLGRSSAPNSLLIWTHKMRQIKFQPSFIPDGAPRNIKSVPAITVGAGTRWLDAYGVATTQHNQYVQGGGCTSVGAAGGFTQGGGFGSYSKKFGTGAAGVLQVEVVTAEGKTLIANQYQNPDLFWAIRGGGGGSFGVVSKMTLMTHNLPSYFGRVDGKITADNNEDYKKLIKEFLIFYRDNLNNEHWGEQVHFNPDNTLTLNMRSEGLSKSDMEKIWLPLKTWVDQSSKHYTMNTEIITIPPRQMWDYRFWEKHYPNLIVRNPEKGAPKEEFWWKGNSDEVYIYLYAHITRWIPIQLFSNGHIDQLTNAFYQASRLDTVSLHFNKGLAGASADAIKRGRETSTNPAVYDAAGLVIMAAGSNDQQKPDPVKVKKAQDNIKQAMQYITAITPNAGTYANESDYFQKNWQEDFWGVNYKRLLEIKQKYDPNGLFYCHHCVGSEYWNDSGMCHLKS